MTIVLCAVSCAVGIFTGWRLTWWWMNRQWQRNPYAFRTLIDEVIKLRIREGRLQPLEPNDPIGLDERLMGGR